jgi:cAMP-specific phosphodiesterase 4
MIGESRIVSACKETGKIFNERIDIFNKSKDSLCKYTVSILIAVCHESLNAFKISYLQIKNFIYYVSKLYKNNHFHSFYHAFNVFHSLWLIIEKPQLKNILYNDEKFAILIAAICHDVGHTGNNNEIEKLLNSNIYKKFGDKSTLEKYHVDLTFKAIRKFKLFKKINKVQKNTLDTIIEKSILATDMANHFNHIQKFKKLGNKVCNEENIIFLCNYLVHSADLTAQSLSLNKALKWGKKIQQEIRNQELTMGKKPLHDNKKFYKIQAHFLKKFILPLFENLVKIFPELKNRTQNIKKNIKSYNKLSITTRK